MGEVGDLPEEVGFSVSLLFFGEADLLQSTCNHRQSRKGGNLMKRGIPLRGEALAIAGGSEKKKPIKKNTVSFPKEQ